MKVQMLRWSALCGWLALVAILCSGCNQATSDKTTEATNTNKEVDDHSGWWCAEHGVPEEVCSLCNAKAAAEFREKGDWCEEHNRAKSQCFICDPSRAEKFTKLYEAKFGEKPPERSD